jgi:hypothetical protein
MKVDFSQVPNQDSGRGTHAPGDGTGQSQIGFLPQVDRQWLNLLVPTCLLASAETNV